LKKKYPACIPVIAFSYGRMEKLSKVWGRVLLEARDSREVEVMIGREFWNFVFADPAG
jgi:hypothetical protein